MSSRILKGAVLAGLVLASAGNAENCREAVLYDGSTHNGQMENSSRTFPEAPEWTANWGDFENMKAPYIRFSGIKNETAEWTGTLSFNGLPIPVEGGSFSISVRSTQNAKFGLWLTGNSGNGNVVFYTLTANSTQVISLPVRDLLGSGSSTLNKVGIGLFGVGAYQYTTLFVDNIKVSCTGSAQAGDQPPDNGNAGYVFRDVNPESNVRNFYTEPVPDAKKALNEETRNELARRATRLFVLTEQEHQKVIRFQTATSLTPKESRDGWYKSMFTVDRNRLRDSVIASPKNLFLEAGDIAASMQKHTIPVLIADIDYAVKYYADTTFKKTEFEDFHLLLAGLPTSTVYGSRVTFVYDPYFVATTRSSLPLMEICVKGTCTAVAPKTEAEIEFDSAGEQEIVFKLSSDGTTVQQKLKVEVK
jgi:hypothetical protein